MFVMLAMVHFFRCEIHGRSVRLWQICGESKISHITNEKKACTFVQAFDFIEHNMVGRHRLELWTKGL
jgi:hypothetical protein